MATALNISDVNVGDAGTEWEGVSESPNFNDIPDNGPVGVGESEEKGSLVTLSGYLLLSSIVDGEK